MQKSPIIPVKQFKNHENVYQGKLNDVDVIFTRNIDIGQSVYGERLVKDEKGQEFREWNPHRSKMSAYLKKGGKEFQFTKDMVILYLGASSGTTVSHLSDIIIGGRIYCIEFSARSIRELVQRLGNRNNIIPILADATQPGQYRSLIPEPVDLVYQDVAQPEQAKLLIDNMRMFLKPGGWFYIAIKARSIDVSQDPGIIFKRQEKVLERAGCQIAEIKDIAPFSDDHVMIVGIHEND